LDGALRPFRGGRFVSVAGHSFVWLNAAVHFEWLALPVLHRLEAMAAMGEISANLVSKLPPESSCGLLTLTYSRRLQSISGKG
jgi:hypothetical protein